VLSSRPLPPALGRDSSESLALPSPSWQRLGSPASLRAWRGGGDVSSPAAPLLAPFEALPSFERARTPPRAADAPLGCEPNESDGRNARVASSSLALFERRARSSALHNDVERGGSERRSVVACGALQLASCDASVVGLWLERRPPENGFSEVRILAARLQKLSVGGRAASRISLITSAK
jgi:hypothetical protein